MKQLAIALSLLITACGRFDYPAELASYVEDFQKTGEKVLSHPIPITNLVIQFVADTELEVTQAAYCNSGLLGLTPPTISLSKSQWAIRSETDRRRLLFHELGHCVLGRDHKEALGEFNCQLSWMTRSAKPGEWCENYYGVAHYEAELFGAAI